ncbi:MAG: hypothetical protein ACLFN5_05790 [bacterium]
MKNGKFFAFLLVAAIFTGLVLIGCGSDTLSGEYLCKEHFSESMVDEISLTFRSDGTFTASPMGGDGTYEIKGSNVVLNSQFFNDLELERDGDRLIAASSAGDIVYVKQ